MEVGVFDSADNVNSTKVLTFPNYSDPGFTGKWNDMGDTVAFPMKELPLSSKDIDMIRSSS